MVRYIQLEKVRFSAESMGQQARLVVIMRTADMPVHFLQTYEIGGLFLYDFDDPFQPVATITADSFVDIIGQQTHLSLALKSPRRSLFRLSFPSYYTGHGEIRHRGLASGRCAPRLCYRGVFYWARGDLTFFPFSPPTPTLPHQGGGRTKAPSPLVGEGWGGGGVVPNSTVPSISSALFLDSAPQGAPYRGTQAADIKAEVGQ